MMKKTVFLKDYKPYAAEIHSCQMFFEILSEVVFVTTTLKYSTQDSSLFLDGEKLELLELFINDDNVSPENYSYDESGLRLESLPPTGSITTRVRLDPWSNKQLLGLYQSESLLVTQCEAEGFRRITFFPDRPDVLTKFQVTIKANSSTYPTVLCNGHEYEVLALENGFIQKTFIDPIVKPCYLFALVAGDLEQVQSTFTTTSNRKVDIFLHTQKKNIDKTDFALDALVKAMRWDEEVWGLEYDLDVYHIVATDHFNMGAMENKGLNVFNSQYVLGSKHSATDRDYKNIMAIIAHEYFHNWTGNRVTLRDWFQLSLKEGLTVFREQQFMEDLVGVAQSRIDDLRRLQITQFTEDNSALCHPVRPQSYDAIDNFYTATVYEKGAEVIRVLRHLVGKNQFNLAVRKYLSDFDGKAATIEDWIAVFEEITSQSLQHFMPWYDEAGLLTLKVKHSDTQACVEQSHPSEKTFLLPLKYQWFCPSKGFSQVELHWLSSKEFILSKPTPQSFLLINHQFTCPCQVLNDLSSFDRDKVILSHDDELLVWQLMQDKWFEWIVKKEGQLNAYDGEFFHDLLAKHKANPSLLAALLTMPDFEEVVIKSPIGGVEFSARTGQLRYELAHIGQQFFKSILAQSIGKDFNAELMAQRALFSTSLSYFIMTSQGPQVAMEVMQMDSMTLKVACLEAIALKDRDLICDKILETYFNNYQHDTLALIPYFKAVALYRYSDAREYVEVIITHKLLDIDSPNHVNALLGTLFRQNHRYVHSHRDSLKDWEYWVEFFAKRNSHLGSRLVTAFKLANHWPCDRKEVLLRHINDLLNRVECPQVQENLQRIQKSL